MVDRPEFYRQLVAGHASSMYTIFGFDRVSRMLLSPDCPPDEWKRCINLVRMIEDAGIQFFASFGIGFDDQDRGVVDRILRFSQDARIDLAEFYIVTPFPGTPFGDQIEREGRLLHRNYSNWNHGNVVFKPLNWTEKELNDDFEVLWREFYKGKNPTRTVESFDVVDKI